MLHCKRSFQIGYLNPIYIDKITFIITITFVITLNCNGLSNQGNNLKAFQVLGFYML